VNGLKQSKKEIKKYNIKGTMKKETNKKKELMKTFKIVLEYNVQRTLIVNAKDEEEANKKAYKGQGDIDNDDWEYLDCLECEQLESNQEFNQALDFKINKWGF
jgi:hypothetical protein